MLTEDKNEKKIKSISNKMWYRLLKVVYFGFSLYLLIYSISVVGYNAKINYEDIIINKYHFSFFNLRKLDRQNSTFFCNNKQYSFAEKLEIENHYKYFDKDKYNNDINYKNDIEKFCNKSVFSINEIYLVNWYKAVLLFMILCLISYIIIFLIKRLFYYIYFGDFWCLPSIDEKMTFSMIKQIKLILRNCLIKNKKIYLNEIVHELLSSTINISIILLIIALIIYWIVGIYY